MPSFLRASNGGGPFAPGLAPKRLPGMAKTYRKPMNFTVSGVTHDSVGALLGSASVFLFRSGTKELMGQAVSDAGFATYSIAVPDNAGRFFVVVEKNGVQGVSAFSITAA